jgi:arsenate reductase
MAKKPVSKIRVLFVDQKNDCTSQLAEYFTKQLYENMYETYSAGPEHDLVDCDLISVMYQNGEDMRRQVSKDFKNLELLPEDEYYDYVIYTASKPFDDWAPKTPWQGKQILSDLGSVKDYPATDDAELFESYNKLIAKVRTWVLDNMKDPENLKNMVTL